MSHFFELSLRDPLVVRDNRFMVGNVMHSARWISPSVMAGSLRTVKGKAEGRFDVQALQAVAVAGPFPVQNGTLFFDPPSDAVALKDVKNTIHVHSLQPRQLREGEGMDLPQGLSPCVLSSDAQSKPVKIAGFWSLARMEEWLLRGKLAPGAFAKESELYDLARPQIEERTHVKIDMEKGRAMDGELFVTQGMSFRVPKESSGYGLSVRVSDTGRLPDAFAHTVGGERRMVQWNKAGQPPQGWECPAALATALKSAKTVRMVLATPALFAKGWLPGWLDDNYMGTIPRTSIKARLVSASLNRWEAVSGWSFERRGPKPIRRTVPAGSVYFFEILEGNAVDLAQAWLKPMSDLDNEGDPEGLCGNDGFGLALWGVGEVSQHA